MGKPIWQVDSDGTWDTGDDRTAEGALLTWDEGGETFGDYLAGKNLTKSYIYDCKNGVRRAGAWAMAQPTQIKLQNFGVTACRKYIESVKSTGVSDRTVQAIAVQLKTFFNFLYREHLFPKHNLERMTAPNNIKAVRPRYAITIEEYRRLLAANRQIWSKERHHKSRYKSAFLCQFHALRFEVMLTMLVDAAMRRGEICPLKVEWIDMKNGLVTLPSSITKTANPRVSALSMDFVSGKLAEWIAMRTKIMSGCENDHGLLFISERREALSPASWGRRFDKVVKAAGLERHITTHACRRAGSSAMDLVGRDVSKLQTGHLSDSVHELYHQVGEAQIAKLRQAKDQIGLFGVDGKSGAAG